MMALALMESNRVEGPGISLVVVGLPVDPGPRSQLTRAETASADHCVSVSPASMEEGRRAPAWGSHRLLPEEEAGRRSSGSVAGY